MLGNATRAATSYTSTMRLLQYKDLDFRRLKPAFDKVRVAIEADDFRSADVKKLHVGSYYRARLDYANRLLLQFARVPSGDGGTETVCLALEVIENHAYEKSRFLRGAVVDEAKIDREPTAEPAHPATTAGAMPLRWVHARRQLFELLDKPLVFDDAQDAVYRHPAPLVIVGSAGSGKTAVTLAKLREAAGRVLYVTLSSYLAQGARGLYAAHGYENPQQEVEFLSYGEFLESIEVPPGREVTLAAFRGWVDRHRAAVRQLGDMDAHSLFEEFRGVIGAHAAGPLSLSDYGALGARQSLLPPAQRDAAFALFVRYRAWLEEAGVVSANRRKFPVSARHPQSRRLNDREFRRPPPSGAHADRPRSAGTSRSWPATSDAGCRAQRSAPLRRAARAWRACGASNAGWRAAACRRTAGSPPEPDRRRSRRSAS
jgi:hypothetical protein